MWICSNRAFLSIVQPPAHDVNGKDMLLVRARVAGHIEAVFPDAKVTRMPGRDYLYRAYIDRSRVAGEVAAQLMGIGYGNFKNSVKNDELHDAYASVWRVMSKLQAVAPYGSDSPAARTREKHRKEGTGPYRKRAKQSGFDNFDAFDRQFAF